MERYIVPMLKALVFLSEEESEKHILKGEIVITDEQKIELTVDRKTQSGTIFLSDPKEMALEEELPPYLTLHIGRESGNLCGITVTDIYAFIEDWHSQGGVKSILPIMQRFADKA